MELDKLQQQLAELEVDGVEQTGKTLGSGSYGVVVEMKVRGLRCAGKKLHNVFLNEDLQPGGPAERLVNECLFQSKLRHPNIVQLIGIHTPDPAVPVPIIIMEYLPMNLTTCLEKYPTLPAYIESSILLDVATGLEFLHTKHPPIMHRDLTSNNVLLTSNMVAKISDLGQAKLFDLKCASKYSTAPGNPCHMPPEALVSEPKYTTKIDIFSFGIIIVHVATHSWPFPATTLDKKTHQVQIATEIDKRKEHFEKMVSKSLLTKLAKRCLQDDPDQRPDAAYLVQEIAKSKPNPPFSNTLEMQLALDAMSKNCQHLEQHIQNIDLQMNAIQDDFPSSHLQKIVAANESALANTCSNNLIVGYHLPAQHTRSSSDIQLTLMESATASKHTCTMELIVRAPLSTHFTGTLVRSIDSIMSPWGLAITKEGQIFIVQNCGWKGVLLYDCLGKKLGEYVPSLSKGNFSSPKGYCYYPKGVAIDKDGNFILVDTGCHRIQKFRLNADLQNEEFLKSAGEYGNGNK